MDDAIISRNLVTIDKCSNLHAAIELMDKKRISRLLVTEGGEIVGILAEEDIANSLATGRNRSLKAEHFHVSGAATGELKTIDEDASLQEAARLMIENKFSSLPVRKNGKIIGLVTKTDLIRSLKDSEKPAGDFYTKDPVTVNPGDSLVHARKLMLENSIRRLLVMDRGLLRGILTERDVAKGLKTFRKAVDKYPQADIKRLKVEDVMTRDPVTLKPQDAIGKAVDLMLQKRISGLPVIAIRSGIITKTDLVRGMAGGRLP